MIIAISSKGMARVEAFQSVLQRRMRSTLLSSKRTRTTSRYQRHCLFSSIRSVNNENDDDRIPPPLILNHPHPGRINGGGNQQPLTIQTVAAPMVAASDYAFRCLSRQYGTDLAYTQMLHAKNLVVASTFQRNHLDLHECYDDNDNTVETAVIRDASQEVLRQGLEDHDSQLLAPIPPDWQAFQSGPLIVQLAGFDPPQVLEAAQTILQHTPHVTGFDLNCGCPQGIAKKGNYGAFLMESDNGQTVAQVLQTLRDNLPRHITVSAKIRLPLQEEQVESRIQRIVGDTGIDILAVHGRTLLENKNLVRACHHQRIRDVTTLAQRIRPDLPVIANGGIETFSDVKRVRLETGASAVMSSEGLLETPQVFSHDVSLLTPRQQLEEQFQIARDYMRWAALYPPLPGVLGGAGSFAIVKGHLFKFLHRYLTEQPDLRSELARHDVVPSLVTAHNLVDQLYHRYDAYTTDEQMAELDSSKDHASWYRRHWSNTNESWYKKFWNTKNSKNPAQPGAEPSMMDLSVEERKQKMRERIQKLQEQKLAKKATVSSSP